jgi:hypothetical protein
MVKIEVRSAWLAFRLDKREAKMAGLIKLVRVHIPG